MLLCTLAASALGNMLAGTCDIPGEGVVRASEEVIQAVDGKISAGQDF